MLITDLFVNMVLVLGFQVFIGNTGVLSFGHLGVASITTYTMALLAVPVDRKLVLIPNAPWGSPRSSSTRSPRRSSGSRWGSSRHPARSRRGPHVGLAATMITLAFLSIVRQVAENRKDLTGGAQNLSGVPRLDGWTWAVGGAFVATTVAVFFRSSKVGRLSVATHEDGSRWRDGDRGVHPRGWRRSS